MNKWTKSQKSQSILNKSTLTCDGFVSWFDFVGFSTQVLQTCFEDGAYKCEDLQAEEKNEVIRRAEERMLMWDEDYRVLHEAVDKWFHIAEEYRTLYRKAQLKIAKQHGRTRTGGKPGRPRKQPLPSPPKEVIKITPRKRKRAK